MKDLLLTEDYDLEIANGDFVIGEADAQNVELLCLTSPGQWKENPTAGIGLVDLLNSEITEGKVKHRVNVQIRADGAKLKSFKIDQDDIEIEADYEN